MATRGRPRKTVTVNKLDRLKYFRRKYNERKKTNKTFGQKDCLKVRVWQCVVKNPEDVWKFPTRLRQKLHRYNYIALAGSTEIPTEYLQTNEQMAEFIANQVGQGEFIIKSGYAHKDSKRVCWRSLIRFKCRQTETSEFKIRLVKVFYNRINRYWFRKYNKNNPSNY